MYAQFLTEQVKELTTTTTVKRHKIQSLEFCPYLSLALFSGNSRTSQTLKHSKPQLRLQPPFTTTWLIKARRRRTAAPTGHVSVSWRRCQASCERGVART